MNLDLVTSEPLSQVLMSLTTGPKHLQSNAFLYRRVGERRISPGVTVTFSFSERYSSQVCVSA